MGSPSRKRGECPMSHIQIVINVRHRAFISFCELWPTSVLKGHRHEFFGDLFIVNLERELKIMKSRKNEKIEK